MTAACALSASMRTARRNVGSSASILATSRDSPWTGFSILVGISSAPITGAADQQSTASNGASHLDYAIKANHRKPPVTRAHHKQALEINSQPRPTSGGIDRSPPLPHRNTLHPDADTAPCRKRKMLHGLDFPMPQLRLTLCRLDGGRTRSLHLGALPAGADSSMNDQTNADSSPIHTVYFGFGDDSVSPSERQRLDQAVDLLSTDNVPLVVRGFTDSIGFQAYNDDLARRRSEAVRKAWLPGIAAARIETAWTGRSDYVGDNRKERPGDSTGGSRSARGPPIKGRGTGSAAPGG